MKLRNVHKEVKRFTRIQKILISLIIVLVLVSVITLISGANALSKFGYNVFSLIRYSLIDHPVETISDWQKNLDALKTVQEENDRLNEIIASQKSNKAELDEKTRMIQEMEELMNFKVNANYDKVNASVMYRDISTWSNTIVINKGSRDGLAVDMAVITSKGLLGKVSEVSENSAKVKLLSTENGDVNVSVRVELKEGTTDGILENYDMKKGVYKIQLFDANAKVEKGMKLITSGNGGVFPPGILIGKVADVEESYNSKGKTIEVKPSVDFNDFSMVSVLKVK